MTNREPTQAAVPSFLFAVAFGIAALGILVSGPGCGADDAPAGAPNGGPGASGNGGGGSAGEPGAGGPTCVDGVLNGSETGKDCGGQVCPACAAGLTCAAKTDCASGLCLAGRCANPVAFAAPVSFSADGVIEAVALVDVDQDKKLDLLVTYEKRASVGVFLGRGDGTFAPGTALALPFPGRAIGTGDFDEDGNVDIVVTVDVFQHVGEALGVHVLLGAGDGSFATPTGTAVDYQYESTSLVIADLDGDGHLDALSAIGNDFSGSAVLLTGTGTGLLKPPRTFAGSDYPTQLAGGDFDGDGKVDLALASSKGLFVLPQKAGWTTSPRPSPVTGINAKRGLALADFDQDGDLDLATSAGIQEVRVLLNDGKGTFAPQPPTVVAKGSSLLGLVAADFNGDGLVDLATSSSNNSSAPLAVLLGQGDGTFDAPAFFAGESSPNVTAVGDVDGDGKPDVVTTNDKTVWVTLGQGK